MTKCKLVIVEDRTEDLEELLDCLGEAGFTVQDILGQATTYDSALELLSLNASSIDLVLLDLNLPRSDVDSHPEKGHGRRLLDHIANLNLRPHIHIQVIVVSAENLDEVWDKDPLLTQYAGTLLGFVQKAELNSALKESLARIGLDQLRDAIIRANIGVTSHFDRVANPSIPIRERLEEACALATRLLRNDLDYTYKNPRASVKYSDDLNGLIWKIKEDRFSLAQDRKPHINAAAITSPGGWSAFLWRGCLEQHLYTLLRYRNDYVHIRSKPFTSSDGQPDAWVVPPETLSSLESGKFLGQVIELIVRDLLQWYLPWHQQVYLPWLTSIKGGATT